MKISQRDQISIVKIINKPSSCEFYNLRIGGMQNEPTPISAPWMMDGN